MPRRYSKRKRSLKRKRSSKCRTLKGGLGWKTYEDFKLDYTYPKKGNVPDNLKVLTIDKCIDKTENICPRGSFSETFLVEDTLKNKYAMKIFYGEFATLKENVIENPKDLTITFKFDKEKDKCFITSLNEAAERIGLKENDYIKKINMIPSKDTPQDMINKIRQIIIKKKPPDVLYNFIIKNLNKLTLDKLIFKVVSDITLERNTMEKEDVEKGNENHKNLQDIINSNTDETKKRARTQNFFITKLIAHGNIADFTNLDINNILKIKKKLYDKYVPGPYNHKIQKFTNKANKFFIEAPFSICERGKAGELHKFLDTNEYRVKKPEFKLKFILNVLIQVSIALELIHYNDLIYHDLKPENIVINEFDPEDPNKTIIRLIDFDTLSKEKDVNDPKNPEYHFPKGTIYYIAPEIIEKFKSGTHIHLTSKLDIFSFGIMILNIMIGKKNGKDFIDNNFLDDTLNYEELDKLTYNQIDDKYSLVNSTTTSEYLIELGISCVKKDPRLRPTAPEILKQLLKLLKT